MTRLAGHAVPQLVVRLGQHDVPLERSMDNCRVVARQQRHIVVGHLVHHPAQLHLDMAGQRGRTRVQQVRRRLADAGPRRRLRLPRAGSGMLGMQDVGEDLVRAPGREPGVATPTAAAGEGGLAAVGGSG